MSWMEIVGYLGLTAILALTPGFIGAVIIAGTKR